MKINRVPFYKLFRFTNGYDVLYMIMMLVSSAGVGLAVPMNVLIFKDIVNILVNTIRADSYLIALNPMVVRFLILASGTFVCGFIQMICVMITSQRQGQHYKNRYFSALLRQEMSWFDGQRTEELMKKINDDIESIQITIVDKLSFFVQQLSAFIGSVVIAFVTRWDLALFACIVIPLMAITFLFMIHFVKKYSIAQSQAYSLAGGIARDIIGGIRVVMAFNAQEKECKRYSNNLKQAEKFGVIKAVIQGLGAGMIGFSTFSVASLLFYLGATMVSDYEYDGGVVVLMFLSIVIGSIVLGNAALLIDTFLTAQSIAYPLFQVIEKKLDIDPEKQGFISEIFDGDITFKNVNFEYPSQPGVNVLEDLNLTIPNGKTVALIGPRGSGKSAVIHLLQRLYDPTRGTISLNGTDLKDFDLKWYRSNISILEKVPTLFSGTIEENINLGKKSANNDEVMKAAVDANAKNLIMNLNKKFQTDVEDIEAKLSVGEKQLISIARALIRKPRLLLIDKALAGLDIDSEREVEESVFQAMSSDRRTVVFAAHYLKYVREADIIVVMKEGKIVEQGNHDELMEKIGLYHTMIEIQKGRAAQKEIELLPQVIRKYDTRTNRMSIEITDGTIHNSKILSPMKRKSEMRLSLTHSTDILNNEVNIPRTIRFQSTKDFFRIMQMHKGEVGMLVIVVIASILVGVSFPAAAVIYAEMFQVFASRNNTNLMLNKRNKFCGLMLLPAFVLFVGQLIKALCLGIAGEALTTLIRKRLFAVILKQDMAWFDKPENALSNLTSLLSTEVSLIKGMSSIQLSIYVEVIATIITFFAMGFYFSWMLTLPFIIFIPLIILAGVMQGKLSSNQRITWTDSKHSNSLLLETLNKVKTIQFLDLQNHFCDRFLEILKSTGKSKKWKFFLYGLLNAICTSALSFAFCTLFKTGSIIIDKGYIAIIDLTRVVAIISISSVTLGRTLSLTPDIEKAQRAARRVLTVLDQQSSINIDFSQNKIDNCKLEGNIEFKNIGFRYPNRLNAQILRRFDLKITAGETVAIVGHARCGKSTITRLLERFYDPLHGSILLDGLDLRSLDLRSVRGQLALLNRESYVFEISFFDNITFGSERVPNLEDVEDAARKANIHDFIKALPEGYYTKICKNGCQLNASQKQRLCIARAFYSRPQIWLLDEATCDIDPENEPILREALDRERQGCTCIIIRNKYSEIQNNDKIVVLENGFVEEIGTHEELLNKRGRYYELNVQHID